MSTCPTQLRVINSPASSILKPYSYDLMIVTNLSWVVWIVVLEFTPVVHAVINGRLPAIKYLVYHGADVHQQRSKGNIALLHTDCNSWYEDQLHLTLTSPNIIICLRFMLTVFFCWLDFLLIHRGAL